MTKCKAIIKKIECLQEFFECDMWFSKNEEWKNEKLMIKYLKEHFKICKESIEEVFRENEN